MILQDEEIVKLINSGFDIELLSFELDIPVEQLQKYKQEPKRKSSNLRKKLKQNVSQENVREETIKEKSKEVEESSKQDYEKAIKKYKTEIARNPQGASNSRNLLAFAYFKSGRIDEARDELMSLIDERSSYMAYRQLIHLEKSEGNFEDAKMWAYDFLDKFSNATGVVSVREQLMYIAEVEGDTQEAIKQLREIIKISPDEERWKKMLERFTRGYER